MKLPRRLDKFLSDAGVGSRSTLRDLHAQGRISVGGDPSWPLWALIDPDEDEVRLGGQRLFAVAPVVYALLHKPAGLITAMSDIRGRPTVASLMPPSWRGSVGPVGRLDKDTTGALLITDDGDLSQLLTQPDHEVWKRYEVELDQAIGEADERLEALRRGVVLGGVTTLPARAGALPGGSGLWICLREGKKRQVRKMVRAVGLRLVHLHRSHVGPLSLGDEPSGSLRILEDSEVDELYEAAGGRDEPRRRAEAALAKRLEAGTLDERSERLAQAYMASGLALEARNV